MKTLMVLFLTLFITGLLSGQVSFTPLPETPIYQGVTITQPAAGANFTDTIPIGEEWDIPSIVFRFVASESTANRYVRLIIEDSEGDMYILSGYDTAITANQDYYFMFCGSCPLMAAPNAKVIMLPLPNRIYIGPSTVIKSSILNIDEVDQISDIVVGSRQGN